MDTSNSRGSSIRRSKSISIGQESAATCPGGSLQHQHQQQHHQYQQSQQHHEHEHQSLFVGLRANQPTQKARSKRCKSLLMLSSPFSSSASSMKSSLLSFLHPNQSNSNQHQDLDAIRRLSRGQPLASSLSVDEQQLQQHQRSQQLTNNLHPLMATPNNLNNSSPTNNKRPPKGVKMKLFEQPLDKLFSPKAMKQLNNAIKACSSPLPTSPTTPTNISAFYRDITSPKIRKTTGLRKFSADSNNNNGQCNNNNKDTSDGQLTASQRQELLLGVLPQPIKNLLNELHFRGPSTVGIFRKSPNAKHCKELRHKLETDSQSSIEEFQVTVIASVFKEWLRSLPDCLLMSRLYPQWIDVAKLIEPLYQQQQHMTAFALSERRSECLRIVGQLLDALNEPNLILLRSFISVLWRIANNSEQNKMSASNLGVCVGQSLLNDEHQSSGKSASATFTKRHRRARSQSILSSTLSLTSITLSSNACYLDSNGAQETAKYVPMLVAFMIENAPALFGQDITGDLAPNCNAQHEQSIEAGANSPDSSMSMDYKENRSTTSGSSASSDQVDSGLASPDEVSAKGVPIPTEAFDYQNISPMVNSCRACGYQNNPMIHCCRYSTFMGCYSRVPKIPIQFTTSSYGGEAVIYNPKPQPPQAIHFHHEQVLSSPFNTNTINSTTSTSTTNSNIISSSPQMGYLLYYRNSLKPQRSHVMSLRDHYLSLQQSQQRQQRQQSSYRLSTLV